MLYNKIRLINTNKVDKHYKNKTEKYHPILLSYWKILSSKIPHPKTSDQLGWYKP